MSVSSQLDPLYRAEFLFHRRHFDECLDICNMLLKKNPLDQAVWYLKTRALTNQSWIDETELEEEGISEILLDENSIASVPRPGTSLFKPKTAVFSNDASIRPVTASGRPMTGFSRTAIVGNAKNENDISSIFKGNRPGTSRPMTSLGRQIRLGTASMNSDDSIFINADKLDLVKYSKKITLAKILCDYLLSVENNARKALELSSLSLQLCDFKDWWWKYRCGRCYYKLGLYREAEKQYKSILKELTIIDVVLELIKVYYKLDLPNNIKELLEASIKTHPNDVNLLISLARIFESMGNYEESIITYGKVLKLDQSNIEAMSTIASSQFYEDKPEASLKLYRRILQCGIKSAELWSNIALCCFYSNQYEFVFPAFQNALQLSKESDTADIWFNISVVLIGLGQEGLAYQSLKIGLSLNNNHSESYNNIGVLEIRKGELESGRSNYRMSQKYGEHMYESYYNGALIAYRMGEFQDSYILIQKALEIYPNSINGKELYNELHELFFI